MYTYAFFKTPKTDWQFEQDGIAGQVQVVRTLALSALVEPNVDLDEIQQNDHRLVQAVLTHDRIICDLFWATTILPLRFGTCFVSPENLLQHLEANQDKYLAKLNQFEGKAEYRLKLVPSDDAQPELDSALKGKDYFLAKKQRYQQQLHQQTQQQQELRTLLDAIAQSYPNHLLKKTGSEDEKIYLLVNREAEDTLYTRLELWQSLCPTWELTLGDALPPYHFV
ncbi:GvpL/GvpF family gas vesicle protein [Myxacorys almedinensis]|uniref:Gas vesicle protein n=1 Tax=Myxacorys almedinensis A TaxID=2690445 RepID=A0A8J7Z0A1_9CYAN|nr:GvpL/GvpF family gas vesicle protein [Myxacorys almedinensis]NDJ17789.1 gas vesicle protein [Myxacorys almedinensis A]